MSKLNEMLKVVYSGIVPEKQLDKVIRENEIIEYMDSIWNNVVEDSMFDRVQRKFGISFDDFYHLITGPLFEECEECQGHGVKEKNLIKNGIEMDVPVTCGSCNGLGRTIKE